MSARHWKVALMVGAMACGGDPTGASLGNIEVGIAISGGDSQAGLAISLDHGPPRALSELETRFTGIETGMHTVALENLPLNCAVAGSNPVSVSVASGQSVEVRFAITCNDPGTLMVITETTVTNGARPESYRLILDGRSGPRVSASGRAAIVVGEGDHRVELTDVPGSCAPAAGNMVEFSITAGDTTEIRFDIACPPPMPVPPTLEVTVSTGGFFGYTDPDGYNISLDGVRVRHVGSQGMARLTSISPGPHDVALSDLAAGCSYPGPQGVVVPDSGKVSIRFRVSCFLPSVP